MTIHKFPSSQDRAWEQIESIICRTMNEHGTPAEARENILAWAKNKYYEHKSPSLDFPASDDAIREFAGILLDQKVRLYLDLVDLRIRTHKRT